MSQEIPLTSLIYDYDDKRYPYRQDKISRDNIEYTFKFENWDKDASMHLGTLVASVLKKYNSGGSASSLIRAKDLSFEKPSASKFGDQELTKEIAETVLEIISREKFDNVPIKLEKLIGTEMEISRYYLKVEDRTVGGSTLDKTGIEKIAKLVEEIYKKDKTYAISSSAGFPRVGISYGTWTVDFKSFVKKYGTGIDIQKEFEKLRGYALSKGLGIV